MPGHVCSLLSIGLSQQSWPPTVSRRSQDAKALLLHVGNRKFSTALAAYSEQTSPGRRGHFATGGSALWDDISSHAPRRMEYPAWWTNNLQLAGQSRRDGHFILGEEYFSRIGGRYVTLKLRDKPENALRGVGEIGN